MPNVRTKNIRTANIRKDKRQKEVQQTLEATNLGSDKRRMRQTPGKPYEATN